MSAWGCFPSESDAPDSRFVLRPQSVPRSLYLEDAEINLVMTPTIFREGGFRFYFFSREEPRMHVHVHCADGEAKFWLEPTI